jgi:predicted O-methyltransferase YrrM
VVFSKIFSRAWWGCQHTRFFSQVRKVISRDDFFRSDAECTAAQRKAFGLLGWNFDRALARLEGLLKDAGMPPFDVMADSQHWMVFSALADAGFDPKKIIEIGTFDGECTALLSKLFPRAAVITFDLPDDSQQVRQSYGRSCPNILQSVLERREQNLSNPNITFVQRNSFYLPTMCLGDADLIWLDGDHAFPALAWDFCNAFHALRHGGLLVCDDVIRYPKQNSTSRAHSRIVLDYLDREKIYSVDYVLKRIALAHAADPWFRKYLGVLRK